MSREEWLRHAVDMIDDQIFNGECKNSPVYNEFQIACGWTKYYNALGETVFPYEGEDVSLDDFFPVTIHVNVTVPDHVQIIAILVHECIHAFFDIRGHGKKFKEKAKEIGFEKPYAKYAPSRWLLDNCESILRQMTEKYGDFPGKPIKLHKGEEKEKKKNTIICFCPNCGYEVKVSRKMFEKYKGQLPTCPCGAKMAQDLEDEESEDQSTEA